MARSNDSVASSSVSSSNTISTIRPTAKKLATTVYITEEQQELLKELNRRTRVPIAEFVREGIDLVLERHRAELPGQLDLMSNKTLRSSRPVNSLKE